MIYLIKTIPFSEFTIRNIKKKNRNLLILYRRMNILSNPTGGKYAYLFKKNHPLDMEYTLSFIIYPVK